ncbi:MAG: peptidase C45 [Bacteroidetes bacterium]|nr:MAG: peptidase C45 [Bacteroidota bacterium]
MSRLIALSFAIFIYSSLLSKDDPRLLKSSKEEKSGWIYVHLEGTPHEIGYQHGYLLSAEIDDLIHSLKYFLKINKGKDWNFYRDAVKKMSFWSKTDKEYQDEIGGIVEGLRAKGKQYDITDIVVLNAYIELSSYYLPYLKEKAKPGTGSNQAPGNCSGFVATGSYTSDGKIAIGHNNWSEYIVGERWNIIADIVPTHGNRLLMDMLPGFIHSGDDFAISSGGILITETTITQFKGFDEKGIPEFVRARKAAQYANSIDDFVKIMTEGNNGGYANDWLVGDIKNNEIARLELGLKNYKVWRTHDGIYVGSNFASDDKLIREETTFNPNDSTSSPNARRRRWENITEQYKGRINDETGRVIESDTYNELTKAKGTNRCVIAGRVDTDPKGVPEWDWPPYFPGGTVQGKVTTADLARDMKFWAHMGNPSGEDFIAAPFFAKHPEHRWQAKYLHDMKAYPWTLFEAKK